MAYPGLPVHDGEPGTWIPHLSPRLSGAARARERERAPTSGPNAPDTPTSQVSWSATWPGDSPSLAQGHGLVCKPSGSSAPEDVSSNCRAPPHEPFLSRMREPPEGILVHAAGSHDGAQRVRVGNGVRPAVCASMSCLLAASTSRAALSQETAGTDPRCSEVRTAASCEGASRLSDADA